MCKFFHIHMHTVKWVINICTMQDPNILTSIGYTEKKNVQS